MLVLRGRVRAGPGPAGIRPWPGPSGATSRVPVLRGGGRRRRRRRGGRTGDGRVAGGEGAGLLLGRECGSRSAGRARRRDSRRTARGVDGPLAHAAPTRNPMITPMRRPMTPIMPATPSSHSDRASASKPGPPLRPPSPRRGRGAAGGLRGLAGRRLGLRRLLVEEEVLVAHVVPLTFRHAIADHPRPSPPAGRVTDRARL